MRADGLVAAPSRAVERFVFASEDARRLAAVRIGLFGLLAARLAINNYESVAGRPGLAVELGFWLCLPFARLRWLLVPAAVGLHLGIWLTMGLDYSAQALTVVVVFVSWPSVVAWVRQRVADAPATLKAPG